MLAERLRPLPGSVWAARGGAAVLGLAATWLSIVSLGLPSTVLLAGGWALAAGLGRAVPGLDGPVSWAAALLVEVALVCAESLLLAAAGPHEHGWRSNLAMLCVPGLVGVVLLVVGQRTRVARRPVTEVVTEAVAVDATDATPLEPAAATDTDAGPLRTSSRPLIALTVITAGLLVPIWIASHGVNFRVAWAMSGDSRNHVVFVRKLLATGGLTISQLKTFPAAMDNVASVIAGAGGRGGLAPGRLMLHDVQALVATYVLAGIAVSLMVVAALLETLPPLVARCRRLPAGIVVLVLLSAGVSATPLVLGTSVQDGFVSAYATVPLATAGVVAALRCMSRPSPASFALIGPAGVLAYLSWTVLAVLPVGLLLVVSAALVWQARSGGALRRGEWRRWLGTATGRHWLAAVAVSWGCLLVLAAVTVAFRETLRHQFVHTTGSITPPSLRLLWGLGFLALALAGWGGGGRRGSRAQSLVPLGAVVVSGATVKFLIWLTPTGDAWTYYALKALYLLGACLLWIAFLPALHALARAYEDGSPQESVRVRRATGALRVLQAAGSGLLVFVLLGWSTPLTSPLSRAADGWVQPSAGVVTEVARIADQGKPFILWHWTDPGNERLGDFWAGLVWGYDAKEKIKPFPPTLSGGMEYWAYVEQAAPADVCAVARGVPGVYVVTHDKKLKASLDTTCPNSGVHVLVE